jgi:predicted nucleic acid-binding protein
VAILLDTGILYAYYDRSDSWHNGALDLFKQERGSLIIPAPVIAEVDYFLSQRVGQAAQWAFYQGIIESDYLVVDLSSAGYSRVLELNRQYADLELGFVDAAVIAIAEDLDLGRIATTDRRHFGAVKVTVPLNLLP